MGRTITLVLTHPFDPTADYVVSELNRRGAPVFRCDPGEFPQRLSVTARLDGTGPDWAGSLRLPERQVNLADVGCVYYRRPTGFDLPAGMSDQVRRWAAGEARIGLGGVLSALPRWLNHPAAIAAGEVDEPVRLTAHLFQEWIDKRYEVRLTVVDDVFLAARIDTGGDTAAAVDWRTDYEALTYTPLADIPSPMRAGVSALMGRLGLRFGALDFIVTPDDRWIFLEINPNGQWAWIEDATGLPIAASIADALTRENR